MKTNATNLRKILNKSQKVYPIIPSSMTTKAVNSRMILYKNFTPSNKSIKEDDFEIFLKRYDIKDKVTLNYIKRKISLKTQKSEPIYNLPSITPKNGNNGNYKNNSSKSIPNLSKAKSKRIIESINEPVILVERGHDPILPSDKRLRTVLFAKKIKLKKILCTKKKLNVKEYYNNFPDEEENVLRNNSGFDNIKVSVKGFISLEDLVKEDSNAAFPEQIENSNNIINSKSEDKIKYFVNLTNKFKEKQLEEIKEVTFGKNTLNNFHKSVLNKYTVKNLIDILAKIKNVKK